MSPYEQWSGETWYLTSGHVPAQSTIQVIEPASGSAKKTKETTKPKKVPFGFSREIPAKKKRRA